MDYTTTIMRKNIAMVIVYIVRTRAEANSKNRIKKVEAAYFSTYNPEEQEERRLP